MRPRASASPLRSLLRLGLPVCLGFVLVLLALDLAAAQGPGRLTRITTAWPEGRKNACPSMSADGTKISFEGDSDYLGQGIPEGVNEIWLYDTNSMTFTRITASGLGRYANSPRLSADGTRIAFYSDADFFNQYIPQHQYEIWLYDARATTFTRVTTASAPGRRSRDAMMSADGRWIVFHSDSDLLHQGIPAGQDEIWLYDTPAMTFTRITTASAAGRRSKTPSISDDGSRIAFSSDSDFLGQGLPAGQDEIWLCDTQTMTVTRITTASATDRKSIIPNLSADGTRVAFVSDSDFLNSGVPRGRFLTRLYDIGTRALIAVAGGREVPFGGCYRPTLSADGTRMAHDSKTSGPGYNWWEVALYDSNTQVYVLVASAWPRGASADFRISADGTAIVFSSNQDFLGQGIPEDQYEIWLWEDQPRLWLSKTVDDATPQPGQRINYTVVVSNSGSDATEGLVSDTLDSRLALVGPVQIEPAGAGTPGVPPVLASGLTISAGQRVTLTVPVVVTTSGVASGTLIANTAAVTSAEVSLPATGTATLRLWKEPPILWLVKTVDDDTPEPGQRITYTLVVSNSGVDASEGLVSDTLDARLALAGPVQLDPAGAGTPGTPPVLASGLTISAGQRITLTVPVAVTTSGVVSGTLIANTAAVTSAEVSQPATGTLTLRLWKEPPVLWLSKDVDDETPEPGQRISYTVVVSNSGVDASQGLVSDTLDARLVLAGPVQLEPAGAGTPGTPPVLASGLAISAGQRVTLTVPVVVTTSGVVSGTVIANTAAVTSAEVSLPATGTATLRLWKEPPVLWLSKGVDDATPEPGQRITYTVVVSNSGADATNGLVSDTLDARLALAGPVQLDPAGAGTPGTPPVLATSLTISAGERITLTFPVVVTTSGVVSGTLIANMAAVTSAGVDLPATGTATLRLWKEPPILWLVKTVDDATPEPGQRITYTVVVSNSGADATNGLVSDTLDARLALAGPVQLDPAGAGTPGSPPILASGLTISAGQRITLTVPVVVTTSGVVSGTLIANMAAVTSAGVDLPATGTVTVRLWKEPPVLWLDKGVDDATPEPGQRITYTVVVSNSGADATNGLVSDTLDARLVLAGPVALEPVEAGTPGTPPLLATSLTISAGQRITLTVPVVVTTSGVVSGTLIANTAAVTSAEVSLPATGTATLRLWKEPPILWLVKTVDDATPEPGQRITYTVVVSNSGGDAGDGLVSDTLDARLVLAGPVALEPVEAGTPGTPPLLATSLTISAGQRITLTVPVVVTTSGVVSGTVIANTTAVTSAEVSLPATGTATVRLWKEPPVLWLSKDVDDETPEPGQRITYTVVVSNSGGDAGGGLVSDTLDARLVLAGPVALEPVGAGTPGSPPILASGLTISAGQRITLTVPVVVTTSGVVSGTLIANTAAVTSAEVDLPATGTATLRLWKELPVLWLTKTVDDQSPRPGQRITYTVVISNSGGDAGGGLVSDALDPRLVLVGPVQVEPAGAGTPGSLPVLACGLTISAGQRVTLTVPVLVTTNGVTSGTLIANTAAVTSAEVSQPATGTATVRLWKEPPVLWLSKDVDDETPEPGQRITYTVVVSNSGSDASHGLVSDELDARLVLAGPVELEPAGAGTPGTPPVLASRLTISAGQRITLTFPVVVTTSGVASGTLIANTAAVTSAEVDLPATGTATLRLWKELPVLWLTKTVDDQSPRPGQRITYTVVISNSGGDAGGGLVSDALDPRLVLVGPVQVEPAGAGTPGSLPVLACGLTISAGQRVTLTVPVLVTTNGVTSGTLIANTAAVTSAEVDLPATGTVTIIIWRSEVYLPVVVKSDR